MIPADPRICAAVSIRAARENDARAIARLLEELGYPCVVSFARDHIRQSLCAHSPSAIRVAEIGSAVVGFIAWHHMQVLPYPYAWLRITAMCVASEHRRFGIGRLLEATAQQAAGRQRCRYIEVTSDIRRREAHRFYEQLGYAEKRKRFMKLVSLEARGKEGE